MKTFDSECYRLACYFLNDWETRSKKISEDERNDLASTIQSAIDDWMKEQDRESDAKADAALERWLP